MDSGSIQAWAAVVGVLLVIMGLLAGGIWWMSALYSRVVFIGTKVTEANGQIAKVRRTLARHQRGSHVFRSETNSRIQNHELRISSVETTLRPPVLVRRPQLIVPPEVIEEAGLPPEPGT